MSKCRQPRKPELQLHAMLRSIICLLSISTLAGASAQDIVITNAVIPEQVTQSANEFFSSGNWSLVFAEDLNNDKKLDFLLSGETSMWCGSAGCNHIVLLSDSNGFKLQELKYIHKLDRRNGSIFVHLHGSACHLPGHDDCQYEIFWDGQSLVRGSKQTNKKDVSERLESTLVENKESEFDAIRQSLDLVSQVLNFTNWGVDQGNKKATWIQSLDEQCTYIRIHPDSDDSAKLNINDLDPASIRFEHEYVARPMLFGIDLSGWSTVTYANDERLFVTAGRLDISRLQRGWSKVFEVCVGKRRAF